jgi:phage terminase large subunit
MMASALKQWLAKPLLPDHIERGQKPEMIFVDGAAASFFVELQAQGFSNLDTADKRVSYGIGTMASLFSQGNLRVSDRCAGFIKEAPGYSWDSTVIGADQVVKVNDDSLDAARYAIVSSQSEWYGNLREISPSVYVEPINPYEE